MRFATICCVRSRTAADADASGGASHVLAWASGGVLERCSALPNPDAFALPSVLLLHLYAAQNQTLERDKFSDDM